MYYQLLFGRKLQQHNVEFVCPIAVYSIVTFSNLLKAVKPSFIKIYELINNVKKKVMRDSAHKVGPLQEPSPLKSMQLVVFTNFTIMWISKTKLS